MTRRPRILLVNYEYPPLGGGAGTATAALGRALVSLGCDVVVLTSRFRDQPPEERIDGVRIRRIRVVRRRADRSAPAEMLTFIASSMFAAVALGRTWTPDLAICFFGIPGGPAGWLLRPVQGVPYIVSLRGGDVPGFDWNSAARRYHRLAAWLIRFLWRRAAAVVANGTGLQQLAHAAAPDVRVDIVPNGVDTALHAPDSAVARASADGPPRVLLVGRLVHQKGADLLLHALGAIAHVPFTFEIVGDGPDRALLRSIAAQHDLLERVRFTGWVERERIADHYRAADVFAFPSRIEGMPNVVLEAMAHELAIVATDVPGNRDLVEDGRTGLVVPPEDVGRLATALERVLRDPALRARLGSAARAHVLAHHTWRASAAAYLRLGGIRLDERAITAATHAEDSV